METRNMETRRNSLKIIGAVGATCVFPFSADELYGQDAPATGEHSHAGPHYNVPVIPPFEPKFFTAPEGLLVVRLADLIIPATGTPSASAAGVPQYIDSVVGQSAALQKVFREGLARLNAPGKPFLDLTEAEQIAALTPLSEAADAGKETTDPGAAFFLAFKSVTADGYYTSYAGLVQELGYKGNQALPSFEGCLHEH